MNCSRCNRQIGEGDRYCPWCGEPVALPAEADSQGVGDDAPGATASEPIASDRELRAFRTDLDSVVSEVSRLSLRLVDLERRFGAPGAARTPAQPPPEPLRRGPPTVESPTARPAGPPAARPEAATPVAPVPAGHLDVERGRERREPVLRSTARQSAESAGGGINVSRLPDVNLPSWNWEWLVGGNWLARIGVVALIFGVAFFISLAIDRGWLGEVERVVLGLAGGLVLLGAGEFWRRRYGVWAQTVTGGGLAILYLSVYGAFALYELISPLTAFAGFSVITLAGALLSLRHEAMAVAVFSIFGGFATPLLLQERLPDQRLLLAYVLVLDVGVLALASFRNWRWFTLLALVGSLVLFAFWYQELEPTVGLAQIGITAIFLVFAAATVVFHLLRQQAANVGDLLLITLNAAAYYGISYTLMNDEYRPWMGGFTAALAAFYVLAAASFRKRGEAQKNLMLFSAGLAVVFAVLAVPIQLGGPWISVAWGLEALVLVWMSFPLRMRELRWAGYAMFQVSAVWLVAVEAAAFSEDFTPFLNEYMISYAAAVILPALAGWLLHLRRAALEHREEAAIPGLALLSVTFAAIAVPVQLDGIWVTVAWALEAGLLLWLSFPLRMRQIRWSGYGLFVVLSLWLLAADTPDAFSEDLTPFLNLYTLAYGAVILSAVFSSWLLWYMREELEGYEQAAYPVYAVVAAASAAIVIPVQVSGVWITVGWAAESLLLLVLSQRLGMREIRWFGFGLLAAMLVRLLGWDTFDTDSQTFRPVLNWRFLAFATGIAALYSAAVLEFRRTGALESMASDLEGRAALPVLVTLANLATLWLLSAEIIATAHSSWLGLSTDASENVASLGLSLLWAVYAAALIVLGVIRRLKWVRLAGLALLAIPVIKLFAYDSRTLEQEYRVIAFIALGLLLIAGGLLYQRYSRVVRGFLFE